MFSDSASVSPTAPTWFAYTAEAGAARGVTLAWAGCVCTILKTANVNAIAAKMGSPYFVIS